MSHYEILGINSAASKSEIMKAFRQQSLIYHPDKQGGKKVSDDTNDYFIALVNVNCSVLIVADIAFLVFFNK